MMRTPASLAVWLMVGGALAGCAGDEARPDDVGLVEVDGILIAADRGILQGEVRNEGGIRVPDARVQLLGTEFAAETDGKGGFRFVNVTAEAHTLRVEASGFLAHEEEVLVGAANLTDVVVHILPDTRRGPGYNPHIHDYWAGNERHALLDDEIDFTDDESGAGNQVSLMLAANDRSDHFDQLFFAVPEQTEDGRPNLVYPGAERIEFTLDWDTQDWANEALGIEFRAPGHDFVKLGPEPPGTVLAAQLTPEMTDSGHQMYTFWEFYLYIDNEPTGSGWSPGAPVEGTVHIKVEVVQGDQVPLEAPHPDFWGNSTRKVLVTNDKPALTDTELADRFPYWPFDRRNERGRGHYFLPEGVLVPPGTTRMTINHTWEYDVADGELQGPGSVDHVLTWKTADQHPRRTPFADYRRAEPEACGDQCRSYDFGVDEAWPDAFYQEESIWAFLPSVAGYENTDEPQPDPRGGKIHYLEIIAYREG